MNIYIYIFSALGEELPKVGWLVSRRDESWRTLYMCVCLRVFGFSWQVCAASAAGLGARVALIEQHLMGGDCLNHGCVPSKALIVAARKCDAACRIAASAADGPGGRSRRQEYFQAAMRNMRRIRAQLSRGDSVERFTKLGVDVFLGEAKYVRK